MPATSIRQPASFFAGLWMSQTHGLHQVRMFVLSSVFFNVRMSSARIAGGLFGNNLVEVAVSLRSLGLGRT